MRRALIATALALLVVSPAFLFGQTGSELKVFISVDMEGITGVTNWEETSRTGKDYDYFRRLMSQEASAAVEGAVAAGATEIIVRDSHGSARNILPDLLNKNARLIRDWADSPKSMMEGIDETFAAAVFIGYHAKAGTEDALLEHTMSGDVTDVSINRVSLPEAGINALIAGYYNVPVVFASGDAALCNQARSLFGDVETVAVKEGIGGASLNLHPEVAQERIRTGVEKAIRNRSQYKPYKLEAPYTLVLQLKTEANVYNGANYPGAKRTGEWELTYETDDIMDAIKAFVGMRR